MKELKQSMSFKLLSVLIALKPSAVLLGRDEAEQDQMQYKKCKHPVRIERV